MTTKKPKSQTTVPVVFRMPKKIVAALDKAAEKNGRSRSKEGQLRLLRSLEQES